jgi:hypothetical protein
MPGVARRLPPRLAAPLAQKRTAGALARGWIVIGAIGFLLLVPAPSAFFWRMSLPVQGPAIVLVAVLLASAAAWVTPKYPAWAAVAVAVAFLARPDGLFDNFRDPPRLEREPLVDAIEFLRGQSIEQDAKLYAVPLHHFPLMFYSGLPIQSVAPVRPSFLDGYGGDVIIIDSAPRHVPIPRQTIAAAASDLKRPISADEVREWDKRLESQILLEDLSRHVAHVEPKQEPLPDFVAEAVRRARARPPRQRGDGRWQNPAMFRGFESYHKADFWPIFFYRFVNPAARSGDRLNYARRIRNATATVLPEGWVVYRSPEPVALEGAH